MNIVLDTNLLIDGFDNNEIDSMCILLNFVHNEYKMVNDYESVIIREYRQNLNHKQIYHKWYSEISKKNKIEYASGKLDNAVRDILSQLGFHEQSDQAFVGSALNTDRKIITEDSDYGKGKPEKIADSSKQKILEYMTNDLVLQVMDYKEAKEFLGIDS